MRVLFKVSNTNNNLKNLSAEKFIKFLSSLVGKDRVITVHKICNVGDSFVQQLQQEESRKVEKVKGY